MFLPTYNQCLSILEHNAHFYKKECEVDGYKIVCFNYRMADYMDFVTPIPNDLTIDARELRGLTFVFNLDGSLYKRFLALPKFWNYNETPENQYNVVKDKKIKHINVKDDGSLIMFIDLPNGNIIPKTKMGLENPQVDLVNEIMNIPIIEFIYSKLTKNITPFFELVSFKNKIVLNYPTTELRLLRLRDNQTGQFLNIQNEKGVLINTELELTSLDYLIEQAKTLENTEGWVITFDDNSMLKLKTKWYFDLHKISSQLMYHENFVIEMVILDKLDDILSNIDAEANPEMIEFIEDIQLKIVQFIDDLMTFIPEFINANWHGDIKSFAIAHNKEKYFGLIMGVLRGKDVHETITNFILRQTSKLELARTFLTEIG
jgi:T4 RnlA family RNA ligase